MVDPYQFWTGGSLLGEPDRLSGDLVGQRHRSTADQRPDLHRPEAQFIGEYLLGVLPQPWCNRSAAFPGVQLSECQWGSGHQMHTHPWLIQFGEHRVPERATGIFIKHLTKGPIRAPANAVCIERFGDL